jgi:hypothetical protein
MGTEPAMFIEFCKQNAICVTQATQAIKRDRAQAANSQAWPREGLAEDLFAWKPKFESNSSNLILEEIT